MLVSAGTIIRGFQEFNPYSVVRVETSNASANEDDDENETEDVVDANDTEEMLTSETAAAEPVVGGEEDIGKGIARRMTDKIGSSVFRGKITKVNTAVYQRGTNFFLFFLPSAEFPINPNQFPYFLLVQR